MMGQQAALELLAVCTDHLAACCSNSRAAEPLCRSVTEWRLSSYGRVLPYMAGMVSKQTDEAFAMASSEGL